MAIHSFVDSFQQYTQSSDILFKWTSYNGTWGSNFGRSGGPGFANPINGAPGLILNTDIAITNTTPFNFGFNYKSVNPSGFPYGRVDGLQIVADGRAWNVLGAGNNAIAALSIINNFDANQSNPTNYGSHNVNDGQWHWIELSVLFHTSAGYVKLYVDGVPDIIYSGATCNSVPGTLNNFFVAVGEMAPGASNPNAYMSDFYFDASGSTAFPLGPQYVTLLTPTGNGDTDQYTASNGLANYTCVNSGFLGINYVSDTGTGKLDLYTFGTLGYNPVAINGVFANYYGQNSGSGTANLTGELKTGGTLTAGSTTQLSIGANTIVFNSFFKDANGSNWTLANINSMQIGQSD
jgi:hypothetical protein